MRTHSEILEVNTQRYIFWGHLQSTQTPCIAMQSHLPMTGVSYEASQINSRLPYTLSNLRWHALFNRAQYSIGHNKKNEIRDTMFNLG